MGVTKETLSLSDVDASCVKFDQQSKCLGAIYFSCQHDEANGIAHQCDVDKDYYNEKVTFNLAKIGENVHCLFFVANIFSSGTQSFKDLDTISFCLSNTDKQELISYKNQEAGGGNALICAMIFRMGGTWHFKVIDETVQI